MEYHAQLFVDAEISLEMQNWENAIQENADESTFAELAQLENLLKIAPYEACKYAEDEMLIEFTNCASSEKFFDEAERITAEGCNNEITRYAQTLIWLQEHKDENRNFATAISN
jgi:hypothetical protein